jgi:hypothetical protein
MKILGVLLAVAAIVCASQAIAHAQTDLGNADQFGLLSLNGAVKFNQMSELLTAKVSTPPASCPGEVGCIPDTGAVNIQLWNNNFLAGDAIAGQTRGTALFFNDKDTAGGQCVTGGGGVTLESLSKCDDGFDQSGTNPKATTLLPNANSDAAVFAQTLAGLTATQTLAAISLDSGQNYTITTETGVNVIDVPSIVAAGSNQITVEAGATDAVIINIGSVGTPGELVLGIATQIVLSGGITPDRVLFNVIGSGNPVSIGATSIINGTVLAVDDEITVAPVAVSNTNMRNCPVWTVIYGALIAGNNICIGNDVKIYFYPFADVFQVQGSCLTSSSLAVLVQGNNVSAYVPKASWGGTNFSDTGISAIQIEGTGTAPTAISTANPVNSCASNPLTGQTVCTSNGTDIYLLSGTSLITTLTSGATGFAAFSGGICSTCGVTFNVTSNQALLTEGTASGTAALQYLDMPSQTFETPIPTGSGNVSEELLIDPLRNLILSPNEAGDYELATFSDSTPVGLNFFENQIGGELDSAAEECSTGIALSTDEDTNLLYITDLTQAAFTSGSPAGTWTAPGQFQSFPEFSGFTSGTDGISVAQGSHIAIVTSEYGGNLIGAIQLPATSGTGTPSVVDYVACPLPSEPNGDIYSLGFDPHTVTAYVSPNTGDAIGLAADGGPSYVAVIDLTKLLNTSIVPRVTGTHSCDPSVNLETAGVLTYVAVP